MNLDEIKQKIEPVARRICQGKGMDLVEFNVRGNRNDVQIQVLTDKPGGRINVGECVIINKALLAAIEQEKFLPREIFSLEVSSPGIDRP
jgi:ribosome maturation factor RimP